MRIEIEPVVPIQQRQPAVDGPSAAAAVVFETK